MFVLLNFIIGVSILSLIVLSFVIKERSDFEYPDDEYPYQYFSNLKSWRKNIIYIFLVTFFIYLMMYGHLLEELMK